MFVSNFHGSKLVSSRASASMEMPEANTVITANESAFSARTGSLKRIFRYSGTERALEP